MVLTLDSFSQNQFFISGLSGDDSIRNRVLEALYRRIMRAYREKKTFRVIIVVPLLPGFQVSSWKFTTLVLCWPIILSVYILFSNLNLEFDRGVWMTVVQHQLEL